MTARRPKNLVQTDRKLSPKQERFVEEYILDWNGAQAAIRAGYSEKTARNIACETLAKPYVKKALEAKLAEIRAKTTVTRGLLVDRAHEIQDMARVDRDLGAALRANEQIAKLTGIWVDKSEDVTEPKVSKDDEEAIMAEYRERVAEEERQKLHLVEGGKSQ